MNMKRSHPNQAVEVVSQASRWLKAQLTGADVDFSYAPCESDDPSTFATFSAAKDHNGKRLALHLKIAEIHNRPFVFAEVQQVGSAQASLFPFFADLSTDESKQNLLHYISDFLLV